MCILCIVMTTTLMCCHSNTTGNIVVAHMNCAMHACTHVIHMHAHRDLYSIQVEFCTILGICSWALTSLEKIRQRSAKEGSQIL